MPELQKLSEGEVKPKNNDTISADLQTRIVTRIHFFGANLPSPLHSSSKFWVISDTRGMEGEVDPKVELLNRETGEIEHHHTLSKK